MIPRSSVKPLELVISALHCLKERNGSSPQNILKYLIGKYNVNTKSLKSHVQAGLKRGLSFGLITQKSGLFRLNDVLSAPSDVKKLKYERKKERLAKTHRCNKKKHFKRTVKKKKRKLDKHTTYASLKYKRKNKKCKEKKQSKKKKPAFQGDNARRKLKENRRRKLKRQKTRTSKVLKSKRVRVKKPTTEKNSEIPPIKNEKTEVQQGSVNSKELQTNIKV